MSNEGSARETLRVFISSPSGLSREAGVLEDRLDLRGVPASSWTNDDDGSSFHDRVAQAIAATDLFVYLVSAGDSLNRNQQYEASQMLQRAWTHEGTKIAVVAPAVGAIPTALRNKSFVVYYPADEVNLDRWVLEPLVVERFLDDLLGSPPAASTTQQASIQDDDVRRWRNTVVHLGRSGNQAIAGQDRDVLVALLDDDLNRLGNQLSVAGAPSAKLVQQVLDRTLLAEALDEPDLAMRYYHLVQATANAADESTEEGADRLYAAGLAAIGVADYEGAVAPLMRAVSLNLQHRGALDPRTIAAQHNAARANEVTGNAQAAIDLYRDALNGARAGLGEHHPQTAATASSLARLLVAQGEVDQAVNLLRLAEAAYRRVDVADSPNLRAVTAELDRLGA